MNERVRRPYPELYSVSMSALKNLELPGININKDLISDKHATLRVGGEVRRGGGTFASFSEFFATHKMKRAVCFGLSSLCSLPTSESKAACFFSMAALSCGSSERDSFSLLTSSLK